MSAPAIILWDQAYNRNGDTELPRTVVNAIRTHMDNHTLTGWVRAETLAEYTGLSVRQVRRQIAANVKAGWLGIPKSGNSSGLANSYRLTFPKGDTSVTLSSRKGVMGDTLGSLRKGDTDVTLMVSSMTGKGDTDVTPTTPITTPSNFSITTQEKGVTDDTPLGHVSLSGDIFPVNATTESKGVMDDTLASDATDDTLSDDEIAELLREHHQTGEDTAEQRLIDEIRAQGSIGAKSDLAALMGVSSEVMIGIVSRLVKSGVVIHDDTPGERPVLILA